MVGYAYNHWDLNGCLTDLTRYALQICSSVSVFAYYMQQVNHILLISIKKPHGRKGNNRGAKEKEIVGTMIKTYILIIYTKNPFVKRVCGLFVRDRKRTRK